MWFYTNSWILSNFCDDDKIIHMENFVCVCIVTLICRERYWEGMQGSQSGRSITNKISRRLGICIFWRVWKFLSEIWWTPQLKFYLSLQLENLLQSEKKWIKKRNPHHHFFVLLLPKTNMIMMIQQEYYTIKALQYLS